MKNKNKRELEKYWAKEATKKAKPNKKTPRAGEASKPADVSTAGETKKQ